MTFPTDPMVNLFRERLQRKSAPLGTWLMAGAPSTAEALGRAGFDWLLLDQEHVPLDQRDTVGLLNAMAATGAAPVVRLAANEQVFFKRALDQGAQTVMVPFVDTVEDARRAVSCVKYPPEGNRGFAAVVRASGYGTVKDYGTRANASTFTIIQLETPRAVAALEDIAAVPGVDALFLGPGDLSSAMGHIGNILHPEVQAVIRDVATRCRAAGIPCGIVGPTPDVVNSFLEMGYAFVAVASDLAMMMRQASGFIEAIRPSLARGFESSVY